jgi:hypothetical protein
MLTLTLHSPSDAKLRDHQPAHPIHLDAEPLQRAVPGGGA